MFHAIPSKILEETYFWLNQVSQKRVPTAVFLCQVRRRLTGKPVQCRDGYKATSSRGLSPAAVALQSHKYDPSQPACFYSSPSSPQKHADISGRIAGRLSLMLHRHLYTQMLCKLYAGVLEDEKTVTCLVLQSLYLPQLHKHAFPYPFGWQLQQMRPLLKLLCGSQ